MLTTGRGRRHRVFFDFAAAFPSIEHQLFMEFFRGLGWPSWLVNIALVLCQDYRCEVGLAGARFPGFSLTRGIRKGRPLSPLLYAACSDLLRRLRRCFPAAEYRAFADDLAAALPAAWRHSIELQRFFEEFEQYRGYASTSRRPR